MLNITFLQPTDFMANADQVKILKQHIQETSAEIVFLKGKITPNLSFKEYKEVHEKYQNLYNLNLLAKNELESLLHCYRLILNGKILSENKEPVQRIIKRKIITETDCNLQNSRVLDLSIKSHKLLFEQITEKFSSTFEERDFKIKGVVQLR